MEIEELNLERLMQLGKQHQHEPAISAWIESNWRDFIKTPEDMVFWPTDEYKDFGTGVYFLWSRDGGLLYVGQSIHVGNRVRHHDRYGRFDFHDVSAISVPEVFLDHVEYAYINGLEPALNLRYESPCRSFAAQAEMQHAIAEAWREFEPVLEGAEEAHHEMSTSAA